MSPLQDVALFFVAIGTGTINAVVGSGTLLTFPTLLAFGVPPVTANVSNNVGLVPGNFTAVLGYRRELAGQRQRLIRLGSASLLGGVIGALLLLVLPKDAFRAIVPVLIGVGVVLVIVGPALNRWLAKRATTPHPHHGRWWVWPGLLGSGIYGGYFGAAQGVLMLAILGIGLDETLQRNNATKNVLGAIVNTVAALIFVVVADVDWVVALIIGLGTTVGGYVGASYGRRLPAPVLRGLIVVVGIVAIVAFVLKG